MIDALPFTATGDNEGAYPDFSSVDCGVSAFSRGLWYQFDPPRSSEYIATLSNQDFTAKLSLFEGDACGSLTCLTSTTESSNSNQEVSFTGRIGSPVYFFVGGSAYGNVGNFSFTLVVSVSNGSLPSM